MTSIFIAKLDFELYFSTSHRTSVNYLETTWNQLYALKYRLRTNDVNTPWNQLEPIGMPAIVLN